MRCLSPCLAAAIALATCVAVRAADTRFPDWPCVQAKVPELSMVAMWGGPPIDDVENTWEGDPAIKALVPQLAPRRVPIEDAQKVIAGFVVGTMAEREHKGKLLFAGLFERLNRERTDVMRSEEHTSELQSLRHLVC